MTTIDITTAAASRLAVGTRIRRRRLKLAATMPEFNALAFSRRLGITVGHLYHVETGRVGASAERAGPVFPEYDGRGRCWLNQYVLRELEVAGIQTRREVEGLNGQRRVACVKGFHSFRHTAITMALAAGKTSAQVRRLAGHATEAMQRRYTHLDADDAGDAAEAIGKFW